jgi:hypothetical protein
MVMPMPKPATSWATASSHVDTAEVDGCAVDSGPHSGSVADVQDLGAQQVRVLGLEVGHGSGLTDGADHSVAAVQ